MFRPIDRLEVPNNTMMKHTHTYHTHTPTPPHTHPPTHPTDTQTHHLYTVILKCININLKQTVLIPTHV